MYHVNSEIFRTFLAHQNFCLEGYLPKPTAMPCIIEFRGENVIKAKVEVKNYNELRDLVKFGKPISSPVNKYWIRGNEWDCDAEGNIQEEMSY